MKLGRDTTNAVDLSAARSCRLLPANQTLWLACDKNKAVQTDK
jgi:hypothetical protein